MGTQAHGEGEQEDEGTSLQEGKGKNRKAG